MQKIEVNVKDKYSIFIGQIDDQLSSFVSKYGKILVVTDSNLEKLHLNKFINKLTNDTSVVVFEAGEGSKNLATYTSIIDKLISEDFSKNDLIVAFGGGVVGDIAGFAASTYKRGIDYISVPTSLLGMIDSCVGGKCAINYNNLKNYVGSFYQPKGVFINPDYLKTLPIDEIKNGMGEGLKYYCLIGKRLTIPNIYGLENIEDFIFDCLSYKASIVETDEKDNFERKVLNLGHTLAHAIEEISNYEIKHGVAVANGVLMMAKASLKNNRLSQDDFECIENIYSSLEIENCMFESQEELLKYIVKDKKAISEIEIDVVVIDAIGDCNIARMEVESFVRYIAESAVYTD